MLCLIMHYRGKATVLNILLYNYYNRSMMLLLVLTSSGRNTEVILLSLTLGTQSI